MGKSSCCNSLICNYLSHVARAFGVGAATDRPTPTPAEARILIGCTGSGISTAGPWLMPARAMLRAAFVLAPSSNKRTSVITPSYHFGLVLIPTHHFYQQGAWMYPIQKRSALKELMLVTALLAVGAPQAWAHGGGGGHGGHGGGGRGSSGGYSHASSNSHLNYHGYGWPNTMGASGVQSSQPAWEGFPEDLPFARLQRFVTGHLPHWHLFGRRLS